MKIHITQDSINPRNARIFINRLSILIQKFEITADAQKRENPFTAVKLEGMVLDADIDFNDLQAIDIEGVVYIPEKGEVYQEFLKFKSEQENAE